MTGSACGPSTLTSGGQPCTLRIETILDRVIAVRDVLRPHLDAHGFLADSITLDDWAIAAAQAQGEMTSVARFMHDKADTLNQRGEYFAAEQLYRESETRYLALGQPAIALRSRHMRALVIRAQGRMAEAEELCQTTISDARREGLNRVARTSLLCARLVSVGQGKLPTSRTLGVRVSGPSSGNR